MRKKILIVEDDIPTINALVQKCDTTEFEVLRAKNGKEGLFMALSEHPDVILLDIVMPVMDGIAMLKRLREDEWGKGAKIIMLTNLTDEIQVMEAVQNGVFDFLVKSDWKIEDIMEKIKEKLS